MRAELETVITATRKTVCRKRTKTRGRHCSPSPAMTEVLLAGPGFRYLCHTASLLLEMDVQRGVC